MAKPREILLAHNGVLFMDELPEFQRSLLETLRQPIETGEYDCARERAYQMSLQISLSGSHKSL